MSQFMHVVFPVHRVTPTVPDRATQHVPVVLYAGGQLLAGANNPRPLLRRLIMAKARVALKGSAPQIQEGSIAEAAREN
jgi:hypothetical protein